MYDMKKGFLLILILLVQLTMNAQTRSFTYRNSALNEGLSVGQNTRSSLSMRHALKQVSIVNITDNGYTGDVVQGGKGITLPANEGEPSLPAYSHFVAVPNGATAHIEMGYRSMSTIENVDLLPAAPLKADTDDSPNTYEKNSDIYTRNAFFPERPVTVSEPFSLRGVQTVAVTVVPFQYNPVTKELRVYDDLQFDVRFDGGNGEFGDNRLRSPYWDPILMQNLTNYNQLPVVDYEARMQEWVSNRPTGCEYLIVIPNNESYRTYANQLRDYRIKQGIITEVKSLADMGCTTTDEMKEYFHNAYNTWTIKPVAVLLLGDHSTNFSSGIPAEIVSHPSMTSCLSDNGYADVDGDGLPDMVFSRLVAANASEAQMMVSKQIEYEYSNPNMNASSYDKPITALGWQTDRWFQICSEVVGGYWRKQGKHPVRINAIYEGTPDALWSTNDNTEVVVNYFGPNGLGYIPATPTELNGWDGGTAAQVVAAVNSGCMLLQHRDHGNYYGWGEPSFKNENVEQMTNVGKMTFVNTINCKTGNFNYSTSSYSGCLIEAFMRRTYNGQNAGAVGCIGPTETSFSFVNDTYVWGMYDQYDPQFLPDYGPYANYEGNWRPAFGNVAGKYFLQQSSWPYNTTQKGITYKMFTAHCDAFLTLYTQVPSTMTISHPSQIASNTTSITVNAPEGTVIALSRNNEVLALTIATGSNQCLSFPQQTSNSTITIVGTKQDYIRYVGSISVVNGTTYEITALANPEEGGTITGEGVYSANTECVLTASQNENYDFFNWTLDGVEVTQEPSFSFLVNTDQAYTANFVYLYPHNIICAPAEHGSVSADKATAKKHETVTLVATPNEGYCLLSLNVVDASGNTITVTDNQFIMPNSDVTINAVFVEGNLVHVSPVENGSISVSPSCALEGTVITLNAIPDLHYYHSVWMVSKTDDPNTVITITDNQFVMPDYDVNVSCTFLHGSSVVLAQATNGNISSDVTCSPAGTTVTLWATPHAHYQHTSWLVLKADDLNTTIPVTDNQFTLPDFDVIVAGFFDLIETEYSYIGSGGLMATAYMPCFFYRNYAVSQIIYNAEEIGNSGSITAIALKIKSFEKDTLSYTRKMDIYLKHTDKALFESKSDWETVDASQLVFSGNVVFDGIGWTTITFSKPFEYDGTSNLMVCIDDNTGSWTSNYPKFSIYATGSPRALYYYSDSYNRTPTSPNFEGTGTLLSNNQIILTFSRSGSNESLSIASNDVPSHYYTEGEGPSESQRFIVIGSELGSDVSLNAQSSYEISGEATGEYASSLVMEPSDGSVLANFYVRLKDGLNQGLYSETLTVNTGNVTSNVSLDGEVFGKLSTGWNWWTPTKAMTLGGLEEMLGGNTILINSQDQGFARYDGQEWSGTLTAIVPGQMYRIETNDAVSLVVTGAPLAGVSITLMPGYNWFGYTGTKSTAIATALGDFTPADGDTITSKNGVEAVYNGVTETWGGELDTLVPGHGYIYHSNAPQSRTITLE